MLRDFKLPGISGLDSRLKENKENRLKDIRLKEFRKKNNKDIEIAVNIVDKIFGEISYSVKNDNINLMAKGFIQSLVLRENTIEGVKDFIKNMSDERAKLMIDFIEAECAKRR